jgi:hypothetical protein
MGEKRPDREKPGNTGSTRVFNNLHRVFHNAIENLEVDIKIVNVNFFALFNKNDRPHRSCHLWGLLSCVFVPWTLGQRAVYSFWGRESSSSIHSRSTFTTR